MFVHHKKTRAVDGASAAEWRNIRQSLYAVAGKSVKEEDDLNEGYDVDKGDGLDVGEWVDGVDETDLEEDGVDEEDDDELTRGDGTKSGRLENVETSRRKSETAGKDGTIWKKGNGVDKMVQLGKIGSDRELKSENEDVKDQNLQNDIVAELQYGAEKVGNFTYHLVKRKKLGEEMKEKNKDQDDFNAVLKNAMKASDDAETIVKSGFGHDQQIVTKSKEIAVEEQSRKSRDEKEARKDIEGKLKDAKEERRVAEKSVKAGLKKYQELEAKFKNAVEGKIESRNGGVANETVGEESASEVTLGDGDIMARLKNATNARREAGIARVEGENEFKREDDEVQNVKEQDVEVGKKHVVTDDKKGSVDGEAELKPSVTHMVKVNADDKVEPKPMKTDAEKSSVDYEAKLKASAKDAKKASDDASEIDDTGAEKDQEIDAKLKNIETMQKTIKQTLDNTTMSLNEIQKLKSELEQKVKTVDEKQKEMEGTREELKAAVSKIADVGKDLFDTQSKLAEGRDATFDQVGLLYTVGKLYHKSVSFPSADS